jgi:hypothetical protein
MTSARSRALSWSDFFARPVQPLDFAHHHGGVGVRAGFGFDLLTQFGMADIGLGFNQLPDARRVRGQHPRRPATMRLGGHTAGLAQAP